MPNDRKRLDWLFKQKGLIRFTNQWPPGSHGEASKTHQLVIYREPTVGSDIVENAMTFRRAIDDAMKPTP